MKAENYLTIPEISKQFRVTGAGIRADIRAGKLKAIKIGRQFRVTETALDSYIKRFGEETNPETGKNE